MMSFLLVGCGTSSNEIDSTEQPSDTIVSKPENEAHVHNYAESVIQEATCTESGTKEFACECGNSYTEVIQATGHIYENYASNEDATYLADGTETATCVCGLTDTRTAEGSKLEYTFTDCEAVMYAKQTVNVRDLPTTDGNKLGGLSFAQEVKVTGQCNETGWYRITFGDGVGYVSNNYLQDSKPEQQTATQNTNTGASASTECPYEYHTWIDKGWYMFYIYSNKEEMASMQTHLTTEMDMKLVIQSKYPDGRVEQAACPTKWGNYAIFIYTYPMQGTIEIY